MPNKTNLFQFLYTQIKRRAGHGALRTRLTMRRRFSSFSLFEERFVQLLRRGLTREVFFIWRETFGEFHGHLPPPRKSIGNFYSNSKFDLGNGKLSEQKIVQKPRRGSTGCLESLFPQFFKNIYFAIYYCGINMSTILPRYSLRPDFLNTLYSQILLYKIFEVLSRSEVWKHMNYSIKIANNMRYIYRKC